MPKKLPPNQQLDPWGDQGFEKENSFEQTSKAENLKPAQNEQSQSREIVQNSEKISKQTEIIKELKQKQEKIQTNLKTSLENFTNRFHLSGSLLDKNSSFNGINTQERERTFEEFNDEEQLILEKETLTENDNKKLIELNQKRMGLILEQVFADTLNLNEILTKVLGYIGSLNESEKQNFSQMDFEMLSGELSNFLGEFNQVAEIPDFYRGDNRDDVDFKRVLCDEYDKSMNLNKDVDRRTNYDQFLELEVQKVSEKLSLLAEKVRVNPEKNSDSQNQGDSAEKLSNSVKDFMRGESGEKSEDGGVKQKQVKEEKREFDDFMSGDDSVLIDEVDQDIKEQGKNFFG